MRVRASRIALSLLAATIAANLIAILFVTGPTCGIDQLGLSITAGTSDVELGKAFPLTVVRNWMTCLTPQAFDERSLAPLVARLESSSIQTTDDWTDETRHYAAYAFTPDSVTVAAVSFEARSNDSRLVRPKKSEPLHLRVRSQLDPKSPGVPEAPGPMLPRSHPWLTWSLVGAAVAALGGLTWWRRRRSVRRTPVPIEPPAPVGPGPDVAALEGLARLRARNRAEIDVVEASDIVRTYAALRFGVRANEMTTRELVASMAQDGTTLGAVLGPSDLVKFADHVPTTDERSHVLDAAESFVRATRDAS